MFRVFDKDKYLIFQLKFHTKDNKNKEEVKVNFS